eukprot:gene9629-12965_t
MSDVGWYLGKSISIKLKEELYNHKVVDNCEFCITFNETIILRKFSNSLSGHLTYYRTQYDAGSNTSYHHYQQNLHGIRIYGESFVIGVNNSNGIIIDTELRQYFNEETIKKNVLESVSKFVPTSENDKSIWDPIELVWYRHNYFNQDEGIISLVYECRVEIGTANSGVNDSFLVFVDSATFIPIELYKQTKTLMKEESSLVDSKQLRNNLMFNNNDQNSMKTNHIASGTLYLYQNIYVLDYFTKQVYFTPYSSTLSDPSTLSVGTIRNVTSATSGINFLFRSLSNQQWQSYSTNSNNNLVNIVNLYSVNAYYDNEITTFGIGLTVTDVIGHEWTHGYTSFTSNLEYSFQSGAINEAFSDIFGESLELLSSNNDLRKIIRNFIPTCTGYYWPYSFLSNGNDFSLRWLVGDQSSKSFKGQLIGALRDMYYPECFGNPSTTYSTYYYCGNNDSGGVHSNSGVINRLFAVLVDGGIYAGSPLNANNIIITGLGLTKMLNLFQKSMLIMTSTTNFPEFANILSNTCKVNIGVILYIPDATSKSYSTVATGVYLTSDDCNVVDNAIIGSGITRSHFSICNSRNSSFSTPSTIPTSPVSNSANRSSKYYIYLLFFSSISIISFSFLFF